MQTSNRNRTGASAAQVGVAALQALAGVALGIAISAIALSVTGLGPTVI